MFSGRRLNLQLGRFGITTYTSLSSCFILDMTEFIRIVFDMMTAKIGRGNRAWCAITHAGIFTVVFVRENYPAADGRFLAFFFFFGFLFLA